MLLNDVLGLLKRTLNCHESLYLWEVFFDRSKWYHYHGAPMLTPPQRNILPQVIEPRRLVNQGVVLTGEIAPELCKRLTESVLEISEPIVANLIFDKEERGRKVVHVNASTTIQVACHRCLEPMSLPLTCDTVLGIVWSEDQAKSLPRDLEPWVVEEEMGDIAALVEEELLLVLPFVIYHPEDQCSAATGYSTNEDIDAGTPRENPFSILEQLKNSGSDN
ncbi:MAG: nucleic acid-binding protein [Porticoccaceae bacterium]|nr:MAG: nucleic acid-binding protein [Porticoccaceae bacterium]